MSNMSYCRFSNTLGDFQDCLASIHDLDDDQTDEIEARRKLAEAAREFADEYERNYA